MEFLLFLAGMVIPVVISVTCFRTETLAWLADSTNIKPHWTYTILIPQ